MKKQNATIELIEPTLINDFNTFLKNHEFENALNFFAHINENTSSMQKTAIIKIIYLYYLGLDQEIAKFLHHHFDEFSLYSPVYDKKCTSWDFKKSTLSMVYRAEKIGTTIKPASSIELVESDLNIPQISHYAWVTSHTLPEEIRTANFWKNNKALIKKVNLLPAYQHIMWVNDKNLIPKSIADRLSQENVELRSLEELLLEVNKNNEDKDLEFIISSIQVASEIGFFAIGSNLLRYLATKLYGGIYSDGDYFIYKDPAPLLSNYDAIVGYEASFFTSSFNGFYAVKPNHKIILKILELTERNLMGDNASNYAKYVCNQMSKTSFNSGIPLFSAAVQLAANTTKDLILKSPMIVHSSGPNDKAAYPEFGVIGNDAFSGSWKNYSVLHYD
jgi:mannosyltransferase OCH1-like enzyme